MKERGIERPSELQIERGRDRAERARDGESSERESERAREQERERAGGCLLPNFVNNLATSQLTLVTRN